LRTPLKLSVIVPFFNEQDSIGPLHAAIVGAVDPLQIPFEMVFVDDGSKDSTLARAVELARRGPTRSGGQIPSQLRTDRSHGGRH